MPTPKPLPEHVEIIQSLLMRAPLRRYLSTPLLLLIGLISATLGTILTVMAGRDIPVNFHPITSGCWIMSWVTAAVLVLLSTLLLASRLSKRENKPLNTPGLRHIFRCLAPPLLLGFVTGLALAFDNIEQLPLTASLWIACYGIALISIRIYTTQSLRFLGILMLALGLSFFVISLRVKGLINPLHLANFFIALAFGMFHLIVAAGSITFSRARRS